MAEAMGVDTSRSRIVIFVIAALHAAAAGCVRHMQRLVNPSPFGLHRHQRHLFMAVVGGAGYVCGARWWAPGW